MHFAGAGGREGAAPSSLTGLLNLERVAAEPELDRLVACKVLQVDIDDTSLKWLLISDRLVADPERERLAEPKTRGKCAFEGSLTSLGIAGEASHAHDVELSFAVSLTSLGIPCETWRAAGVELFSEGALSDSSSRRAFKATKTIEMWNPLNLNNPR